MTDIDALAARLADIMTDPSHPSNRLKRPATRTCLECGATWTSHVSLLADRMYCSDTCEAAYSQRVSAILAECKP